MVEISFIIPTYNRTKQANDCIKAILSSNLINIEIIVINDYKLNDFILEDDNLNHLVRVYNNPKKGVASARNLGAKKSSSPLLIFVDDDIIVNDKSIKEGIIFLNNTVNSTYNANWVYPPQTVEEMKKKSFGRYLEHYGYSSLEGWYNDPKTWKKNSLINAPFVTSQFWAIKKQDFETIGGYNEIFPHAGFEDYDISIRMQKMGYTNFIDTSVCVYHNEFDRLIPVNWLERKRRGAETRVVAIELGYKDLEIRYSFIKKIILLASKIFRFILLFIINRFPNIRGFDFVYFKLMNILLATYIYIGYTTNKNISKY